MTSQHVRATYSSITFLFWLASGLPLALLVLFYQARGLSLSEVGLCFVAFFGAVALLELPSGGVADVLGRRRVVLLAMAFMAAGITTYLFAFTLPLFLIGSALAGMGRAFISGSLEAWYVDAVREVDEAEDLQRGLAVAGVAQLGGLGLGLLAGGFLPRIFADLPPAKEAVLTPLSTPLAAALGVWGLAFAFTWRRMREPPRRRAADLAASVRAVVRDGLRLALSHRDITLLLVAAASLGVVFGAIEAFWQPFFGGFLADPEGSTHRFGILYALTFLVAALGNGVAVALSQALKRQYALVSAIAISIQLVAVVCLALSGSFFLAALFFLLVHGASAMAQSPAAAFFNERIPADKRATLISIGSLVMSLGGLVANLGAGRLAESASIGTAWLAASGALVIAIGVYLTVWKRSELPGLAAAADVPSGASASELAAAVRD